MIRAALVTGLGTLLPGWWGVGLALVLGAARLAAAEVRIDFAAPAVMLLKLRPKP